jgi:hypothetical protein
VSMLHGLDQLNQGHYSHRLSVGYCRPVDPCFVESSIYCGPTKENVRKLTETLEGTKVSTHKTFVYKLLLWRAASRTTMLIGIFGSRR